MGQKQELQEVAEVGQKCSVRLRYLRDLLFKTQVRTLSSDADPPVSLALWPAGSSLCGSGLWVRYFLWRNEVDPV
jgi:hypothetical protein